MNRTRAMGALAALVILLAACGPAASGGSATPSPAESTAPSAAAPSQAEASQGGPQPSFSAGVAADLESLIPDSVGGLTMQKQSMRGNEFLVAPGSDPATVKFLQDLGVTPSDISMAIGFGFSTETSIAMFVIKASGANSDALLAAFKEAEDSNADSPLQWSSQTVGGKQVQATDLDSQPTYVYITGDTLIFVSSSDPAAAEQILSGLP